MTDNWARCILLAGFVILAPIGLYYRLQSYTGEQLDRRKEGWWILLTLRPLGIAFAIGVIAYLIEPQWMVWSSMQLPSGARWLGVALGICAGALLIWTFRTLGRNLTDTVVARRNASLVVNGPYHWVRHPFYVAFGLTVVANTLVADSWYLAVTGISSFAVMVLRTSIEEHNLLERFGEDYAKYQQRTGRFIPKLGRTNLETDSSE